MAEIPIKTSLGKLSDQVEGKVPEKKLTKAQQLAEKGITPPNAHKKTIIAQTDEEIVENPPEPTYYNTKEGSIYIQGTKYYHGQPGPHGKTVDCPKMNHEMWAKTHERFEYYERIEDPLSHEWKREKRMLPAKLNSLDKRIHEAMDKNMRLLIEIFRGSRKSTDLLRDAKESIGDTHSTISYFSYSSDQVTEYSMDLRDRISRDPNFLRTYGYIIDDELMNQTKKVFWVPYPPGPRAATRQAGLSVGSVQGMQRTGGHPDVIYVDDPEGEELEDSEKALKTLIRWWTKQILPMAKPNTRIIVAGTPKSQNDLLSFIKKMGTFSVLTIRAIEVWPNGGQTEEADQQNIGKWWYVWHKPDGALNPLICGVGGIVGGVVGMDTYNIEKWDFAGRVQYYLNDDQALGYDNNRMSMQEFLLVRKEIGNEAFESEYQMNAVNIKEGYLGFQNLRYFDEDTPDLPTAEDFENNTCAFFDQAFGDSNRADYNCISVVSEVDDNYYLQDLLTWRGGNVFTKIELVKWMWKKYPHIRIFGIETGLANAEDVRTIKEYLPDLPMEEVLQNNRTDADEDGVHINKIIIKNISEIPPRFRSKVPRIINQYSSTLPSGKFWMRQGIGRDQEDLRLKMGKFWYHPVEVFKSQWSFPFCAHVDCIDSIGSAKEICQRGGGSLKTFFYASSSH